ncbi:hypothetical protein [Mycolicibacterium palauense]|uniref:hypothetical protein n=1 Tax=Mycolicibacterium palauense TaxID=2034511 RepID=UPI000BFF0568|nr:hypothetical protein [Mycolicibacterium palauense]
MTDRHHRRRAKQSRRDARRRRTRALEEVPEAPEEVGLIDGVAQMLDEGHPLDLLSLVSMMIVATDPRYEALRAVRGAADDEELAGLDELVAGFIGLEVRETTALLAVLAALLTDDDGGEDGPRSRCRRAAEAREDPLPAWLAGLAQTTVYRAVRMSHILGDGDDVILGVRLADGREFTCVAYIDHLMVSDVKDAFFVPDGIDAVLAVAEQNNDDPDTRFTDLDPADARAVIGHGLDQSLRLPPAGDSETWPSGYALVRWLIGLLPDGGVLQVGPSSSGDTTALLEEFFSSPAGEAFNDFDHRELLELCIAEGTGDPLRWSAPRLEQLLDASVVGADHLLPLECELDLPELLGAYVPFAHAHSGIRASLTDEALVAIDDLGDHYRVTVVQDAVARGDLDEDDLT